MQLIIRTVDEVHDIMDDFEEQKEVADEIAEAISRPTGYQDYDEVGFILKFNLIKIRKLFSANVYKVCTKQRAINH